MRFETKKVHWKQSIQIGNKIRILETVNKDWKHKSLIGNKLDWKHIRLFVIYKGLILIMNSYVSNIYRASQPYVSNLKRQFSMSFFCFQSTFYVFNLFFMLPIYVLCFQSHNDVSNVFFMFPIYILPKISFVYFTI